MNEGKSVIKDSFVVSLLSGAVAGTAVDVSLFPLDTIKTRLQSKNGFLKSGGFRGIYSGLGPAALGSAPNAAVFFCTYDTIKFNLESRLPQSYHPLAHMLAASCGEIAACLIRVPVEVVKQRKQTMINISSKVIVKDALTSEGILGLYRGYSTTVLREIPFSLIQFPLWELFQLLGCRMKDGKLLTPFEVAVCGSLSGGIAAAVTTPLDVAKTRIMLAVKSNSDYGQTLPAVINCIYREKGLGGLFAGLIPRVIWMSIGGFIFLGSYKSVREFLSGP